MQELKSLSAYRQGLKGKILDTAMTLFAKNGIKAVKMDDIARALNISKRTIYELYENKEVILFEGIKRYNQRREEEMSQFVKGNTNVMDIILNVYKVKVEEFRFTNPLFYDDLEKYPDVMAYLEKSRDENRKELIAFLNKGVKEGYFREDINNDLVTILFDSIGQLFLQKRLYARFSIESVLNNIMFISLRGICTIKGIEVLDNFLKSQAE
jgi:AcrR family transcriptional regulator